MSLILISQSYLVESDFDFGLEEDEVEEDKKLVESSESLVKSYMKSKWDSDDEGTGFNEKSYYSSPNVEPEHQPLTNPSSENGPTSNISEDVLDLTPPEADFVSQIEKPPPTSVSHSPLVEVSSGEIADMSRRPYQSCRPQKKKKGNILRENPRQLSGSSIKPTAKLQIQTLYKCPYCLLIFAMAQDLIQHLPSHSKKNSTFLQTENAEPSKNYAIGQVQKREKLRRPAKSRKIPPAKSSKNSNLKFPKEVDILRPCKIKLTRCDNLLSDWKPRTTRKRSVQNFNMNKNELSNDKTRSGTKRRSAGINARRKMLMIRMQEEDGNESSEEQTDSGVVDANKSMELKLAKGTNRISKYQPHVKEQSDPCHNVKGLSLKEKHYKCETWSKSFGRQEYLREHIQIHADGKLFKCPTCSKRFRTSTELELHIRTHTGEKPYRCPTCFKTFRQPAHLTSHIRIHTGEKPYKCRTCSKGFRTSGHLKVHIRTHTGEKPYKCSTCSKGFAQSMNLKAHIRTHTGEKPYKCSTCSKKFARSISLNAHIRIHTGEKLYKCSTCFQTFSVSANLKRHIRTHM